MSDSIGETGFVDLDLITLTPAAVDCLRTLYAGEKRGFLLQIGVETAGCFGLSYTVDWVPSAGPAVDAVIQEGVVVLVERKAAPYLAGSVMDVDVGPSESGFKFRNPTASGHCGCGTSFRV